MESKRGSDLSNADLNLRFSFGSVPLSEFVWDREGVTPITMFKCYGRVFRFVVKMARQYRRGAVLEVPFVQPATRFLLHQLSALLLDDDAEVRREINYKASEVHIHGRMDSGVFRSESNACFLSNEDKRMDEPLTESDICQAGGELAASVELLRNFAVNPLIFNSLLNSGREWKLLRRILHNSRPLWQFSSSLYVFNQLGEVDMDAVYVLTQMLVHCFSNSKYLINQSREPVVIGYGLEDDTDNDFHMEEDEEEEDGEGDEKEKFAVNTSNNKTLRAATGSKHVGKVKGTGGKSGKNTRKFGTVLTHENLCLFESTSKYEL